MALDAMFGTDVGGVGGVAPYGTCFLKHSFSQADFKIMSYS